MADRGSRWAALERIIGRGGKMTTAEVTQEILHRFGALKRPDAIQPAFDALLGVVDEVLPVETNESTGTRAPPR